MIFDRRPGVHREALRFVLDLAYAKWNFSEGFRESAGASRPARKTLHTYAESLANFLDWCDLRGVLLKTCSYDQSVARYEKEMSDGTWSRSGRALMDTTINSRIDIAVFYLKWLADTGGRARFDVATEEVTRHYGTHSGTRGVIKTAIVRAGRRRPAPRVLTLPTRAQVNRWLTQARSLHGATFELMCRSLLRTALRRAEIVCLRVDSLPVDPADWDVINPWRPASLQEVAIRIEWGAKGSTLQADDPSEDERKAGRTIRIPWTLAQQWHDYRNKDRVRAVGARLKGLKGKERERVAASLVHLFLREDDGVRWTAKHFYDHWAAVPRDFPGKWHPHLGRHWWACMVLFDEVQRLETEGRNKENILSIIETRIRPQLGHLDKETTYLYLKWAMNQIGAPLVLDDECDDASGSTP